VQAAPAESPGWSGRAGSERRHGKRARGRGGLFSQDDDDFQCASLCCRSYPPSQNCHVPPYRNTRSGHDTSVPGTSRPPQSRRQKKGEVVDEDDGIDALLSLARPVERGGSGETGLTWGVLRVEACPHSLACPSAYPPDMGPYTLHRSVLMSARHPARHPLSTRLRLRSASATSIHKRIRF